MKYQHPSLTNGRWDKMSFLEQMANIGSEVERTIGWQEKGDKEYSEAAFVRSLELMNFTVGINTISYSQRKELARAKEMWIDFVKYGNSYHTTKESWRKYFMQLLMAFKLQQT